MGIGVCWKHHPRSFLGCYARHYSMLKETGGKLLALLAYELDSPDITLHSKE